MILMMGIVSADETNCSASASIVFLVLELLVYIEIGGKTVCAVVVLIILL